MTKIPAAKDPTRNVWLQLGFPDAEEHYLKAELVLRLDKAITSLGLTQRVAARRDRSLLILASGNYIASCRPAGPAERRGQRGIIEVRHGVNSSTADRLGGP